MSFETFKTANINICDKLGIVPRSYIDVEIYWIDRKFKSVVHVTLNVQTHDTHKSALIIYDI